MLVPKKWKLQFVIDYRQLKRQNIKSNWLISSIQEKLDMFEVRACFTSVAISSGF